MQSSFPAIVAIGLASLFVPASANAQRVPAAPASDWARGYTSYDIIARRTAAAQNEPGVTRELAPDSRQTATGGPVGGVPGFEGGR